MTMEADKAEKAQDRGLFHPTVLVPFLLVSLIWGSTWLVIKGQLGTVPPSWSVTYRFVLAAAGMMIFALIMRQSLKMDWRTHGWVTVIGFCQFGLNFNLVYQAEEYITSGVVAILFALLIVPNAILGSIWLGRPVTKIFWIGSGIATVGVSALMLGEYRAAPVGAQAVLIGTGLTLTAVMIASISNIMQASERFMRFPIMTILAWSMVYGAVGNALWSWLRYGPPQMEWTASYLGGIAYLAIMGTVVTFPLYFRLIRDIGPGKAAYTSMFIPVVAMALSTIFENYIWTLLAASGAMLVMAGILVAMQSARPAR